MSTIPKHEQKKSSVRKPPQPNKTPPVAADVKLDMPGLKGAAVLDQARSERFPARYSGVGNLLSLVQLELP